MNLSNKIKVRLQLALLHSPLLFVFIIPWGISELVFLLLMLFLIGAGVELGYHRFFSHRAFKTSRWFQLVLALLGTLSLQRGPLWWAAKHREHHRFADKSRDPHSPDDGFFHSHLWWFYHENMCETEFYRVKDWTTFPELILLDRYSLVVPCLWVAVTALLSWGQFHSHWVYHLGMITMIYLLAVLIIMHVFFYHQ
ncbi:hypothetical protein AB835_05465 [Candidatus Endobugula sertula]|uniref:Fatty acid desaturase domain-containing protein n=1 Tax=Candidatus Endobugula sertula TaxID=62101 RepID=A0A1D2QR73_9GAMM|nr:hypothetical protein AB835_05465 [Candidatus Endobugula sertula]